MKKIKLIKKQKSSQSTKWMQRHLNDEYVIKNQKLKVLDQDLHIN